MFPLLKVAGFLTIFLGIGFTAVSPVFLFVGIALGIYFLYLETKWTTQMQATLRFISNKCAADAQFSANWSAMTLPQQKRWAAELDSRVNDGYRSKSEEPDFYLRK